MKKPKEKRTQAPGGWAGRKRASAVLVPMGEEPVIKVLIPTTCSHRNGQRYVLCAEEHVLQEKVVTPDGYTGKVIVRVAAYVEITEQAAHDLDLKATKGRVVS